MVKAATTHLFGSDSLFRIIFKKSEDEITGGTASFNLQELRQAELKVRIIPGRDLFVIHQVFHVGPFR